MEQDSTVTVHLNLNKELLKTVLETIPDKVVAKYGTQKIASLKTGIEESKFSRKKNSKTGWTLDELATMLSHIGFVIIRGDHLYCLQTAAEEGIIAIGKQYADRR